MATKSEINLTFGYGDETTRKFSVGPYPEMASSDLSVVKAAVKNFNATGIAEVANIILSDGGSSCTGIVGAEVTTTNAREINLNDVE